MIFIDEPFHAKGRIWSHLWDSDNDVARLQTFADGIGLKRAWFQMKVGFPHYDLTGSKIEEARQAGAVTKSLREWVEERQTADGRSE